MIKYNLYFAGWQFHPKFRKPWMSQTYESEHRLYYYWFGFAFWQFRFVEVLE